MNKKREKGIDREMEKWINNEDRYIEIDGIVYLVRKTPYKQIPVVQVKKDE